MKLVWVCVDDWHAFYVDGKQVGSQGHSPDPWTLTEVFKALGAEVEEHRYTPEAEAMAEDMGRFPESWPWA